MFGHISLREHDLVYSLTALMTYRFMLDLREASSDGSDGYTVSLMTMRFKSGHGVHTATRDFSERTMQEYQIMTMRNDGEVADDMSDSQRDDHSRTQGSGSTTLFESARR